MHHRFPQQAHLRDGRRVLIRPFGASDVDALHEFFLSLPAEIRRFAWDHVEDRSLIESWGRNLDYSRTLPLLTIADGKIIADATLHRRDGGPLRLVGRIKWLMDPAYRGQGLGTTLVNDFISIARGQGLRHLTCMLIDGLEDDAVRTLTELGFESVQLPGYGADPDGEPHDMVKLILEL